MDELWQGIYGTVRTDIERANFGGDRFLLFRRRRHQVQ